MELSLIAPTKLLEMTTKTSGCFVLPHRMINDKEYAQWIYANVYRFKWVLIDNDTYEFKNPTPFGVVMHFAKMFEHPNTYVVLPDVFKNAHQTIRLTKKVLKTVHKDSVKFCAVIQGKTFETARYCLDELMKLEEIDMIAVPIHMYRRFNRFARIHLAKMIEGREIHFLGLDDPREAVMAKDLIKSIDTSLPFTLAWNWKNMQMRRLKLQRVPFDAVFAPGQELLANQNVMYLKSLVGDMWNE